MIHDISSNSRLRIVLSKYWKYSYETYVWHDSCLWSPHYTTHNFVACGILESGCPSVGRHSFWCKLCRCYWKFRVRSVRNFIGSLDNQIFQWNSTENPVFQWNNYMMISHWNSIEVVPFQNYCFRENITSKQKGQAKMYVPSYIGKSKIKQNKVNM